MSDPPQFATEARYISGLFLATAWAVYAGNMKSKSDAHAAHLAALEACAAFDQEDMLVQTGIVKEMLLWAKTLLNEPDSTAIWTVTFHDLINLAETQLKQYDETMARDHANEDDAPWRLEQGTSMTYLRSLGVVAGEQKSSRWEERKKKLRGVLGSAKLRTKKSLSKLRETLRGKNGE